MREVCDKVMRQFLRKLNSFVLDSRYIFSIYFVRSLRGNVRFRKSNRLLEACPEGWMDEPMVRFPFYYCGRGVQLL